MWMGYHSQTMIAYKFISQSRTTRFTDFVFPCLTTPETRISVNHLQLNVTRYGHVDIVVGCFFDG